LPDARRPHLTFARKGTYNHYRERKRLVMNGLRPIVIGLLLFGCVSCFEGARPIPLPDGDVDAYPEGEDRIDGEGDVHVDVPPGCGNV
jgi:hypothetical protein